MFDAVHGKRNKTTCNADFNNNNHYDKQLEKDVW
jgi:hypothetical protein